jgi:hypothetical protein
MKNLLSTLLCMALFPTYYLLMLAEWVASEGRQWLGGKIDNLLNDENAD